MYTLSGMHEGPASYSMGMGMGGSMSIGMGRGGRGYRRMRSSAPDLPSLLLDSRIIFLGMPVRYQLYLISLLVYYLKGLDQQMVTFYLLLYWQIVPAVTELIAAQFLWLDYDDRTKPIYLYINSTGTMVSSCLNIEHRNHVIFHLFPMYVLFALLYDYTFCSVTGRK